MRLPEETTRQFVTANRTATQACERFARVKALLFSVHLFSELLTTRVRFRQENVPTGQTPNPNFL